ncbi:MAG: M1 family peptidase [Sphingobacteriales bacterium]|nr:MAG: M1 family peptidase [Sphingobacteriales bacterium]
MKKPLTLLICILCLLSSVNSQQSSYWQQQVNFKIDVALNDKDHTLDGFEKIQYTNHSPDTLTYIWFHLWPNAYKNDRTAFSEQLLQIGRTDFYFSDREDRGYINRLDFRINEISLKTEDHPNYIDAVKIILQQPLLPGNTVEITTPFHVKLPKNFSRGGHTGQSYQITQWYPKPAVYDKSGWHIMPYLDQGEFYNEFGNYEVKITLPQNYAVAATGELQNEDEKIWLLNRSSYKEAASFKPQTAGKKPVTIKKPVNSNNKKTATPPDRVTRAGSNKQPVTNNQQPATSIQPLKTLIYTQNNVSDFAWFADKRFIVAHDTIQLASGRIMEAYAFYHNSAAETWSKAITFIKKSIRSRSNWVGEYPYNTISVVMAKMGFEGGMEYPTITSISPIMEESSLERVIEHEVGHNWFQGILGSNERIHPWMDEGINSYYDGRYERELNKKEDPEIMKERVLAIEEAEHLDQPIETTAESFTSINDDIIAYYKTDKWMQLLENEIGTTVFDKAMQEYYKRFQFKHPQPEDFKQVMEEVSGKNLDNLFALQKKKGPLPQKAVTKTEVYVLPGAVKKMETFLKTGNKAVFISPVVGVNSYDKAMIGVAITNYIPPTGNFRYLLAPMYSTGAKTLSGLGRLSYRWFPHSTFDKAEIFVAASKFTTRNFTDDYRKQLHIGFTKIVPGFRLTIKEKDAHSTMRKYIQWKTFLINEGSLRFKSDTVITPGNPADTSVYNNASKITSSRYVNQLKIVIENSRALYPYNAELQIDQGKGFVRTAFTGNYFFNYSKSGGANVRFFAGKFFYTGNKVENPFETYQYHFNMSGARGEDDYTYSNYFIGRTEQRFWKSQQMIIRDGGFKVGTDLLADRAGRSDDWLMAANFTTSVPNSINPLSILPVKIPLKAFLDIGTNAAAWKKDAGTTKFLFDAGLQLSLFKNTLNIYVPLLYSKVYSDYFKSYKPDTKFFRNISFSIDLQNMRLPNPVHNIIF